MIKTSADLLVDFADNEARSITPRDFRNLVDSLRSVGGTIYGAGEQMVTTSWAPLKVATNSIDTRGLTADLDEGEFVLGAGAGGVFAVDLAIYLSFPATGRVELAITKDGNLTPYRAPEDITHANKLKPFTLVGTGNLADGDRVGIAIRGSGRALATIASYQHRVFRF